MSESEMLRSYSLTPSVSQRQQMHTTAASTRSPKPNSRAMCRTMAWLSASTYADPSACRTSRIGNCPNGGSPLLLSAGHVSPSTKWFSHCAAAAASLS